VKIDDTDHLKRTIRDAIESVSPDVLTRVWQELEHRMYLCRATNGPPTELRRQDRL